MIHLTSVKRLSLTLLTFFCIFYGSIQAQMITGTWHGKINRQKVEVKIIQKGDSLTGTSYYYQTTGSYKRYSIKGYFDGANNVAIWWDDVLLEEKNSRINLGSTGKTRLLLQADFNCPGGGIMKLDGNTQARNNETAARGEVHLNKTNQPLFADEWDFVIDNFTAGANDPFIIDSVAHIAGSPTLNQPVEPVAVLPDPVIREAVPEAVVIPVEKKQPVPVKPLTIEQKFTLRQKIPMLEIPLAGDSIEVSFYDNAEIDGDSISLFLNEKLIFQHVFLTDKAFTIKFAVNELQVSNELVMVAENLGSIPPNTSFMVAYVKGQRYEARLVSTEGSSAMIRFTKTSTGKL